MTGMGEETADFLRRRTWVPMLRCTTVILLALGLALFAGTVVVPFLMIRGSVREISGHRRTEWHDELLALGAPGTTALRLAIYIRLPAPLAPHREEAFDMLSELGDPAEAVLLRLASQGGPQFREASRAALLNLRAMAIVRSYPKSEALSHFARLHRYRVPASQPLVTMSAFRHGGPGVANRCEVDPDGTVYTVRDCYNWAFQCQHYWQMPAHMVEDISAALAELPEEDGTPPLDRLLLVSHRQGRRWVTRVYDRAKPPPAVRRIYETTGAQLDTSPVPVAIQSGGDDVPTPQEASPGFTGVLVTRDQAGHRRVEQHWKDGRLDGKSTRWYPNGRISGTGQYSDGQAYGEFLDFYEDGSPRSRWLYEKGKAVGEYVTWDEQGIAYLGANYGPAEGIPPPPADRWQPGLSIAVSTAKRRYGPAEEIRLELKVTNTASESRRVELNGRLFDAPSYEVQVDGEPASSRAGPNYSSIERNLRALQPGESAALTLLCGGPKALLSGHGGRFDALGRTGAHTVTVRLLRARNGQRVCSHPVQVEIGE
jgi:hypothetical protein